MITIRELVQNIKKGQASVPVRHVLSELDKQYIKIQPTLEIVSARIKGNGTEVHLKIPSSNKEKLFYDVVVFVDSTKEITSDTRIKCFSNSPSFAYNFTYVFSKLDSLLYPDKYPREFVTIPPKVRNPFGLYGFDKHVYYSIRKIIDYSLVHILSEFSKLPEQPIATFEEKKNELDTYKYGK